MALRGRLSSQTGGKTDLGQDLRILRSQRNDIMSLIADAGLEPREFRWEHVHSRRSAGDQLDRLAHLPTGYFYDFDNLNGSSQQHLATFAPGATTHEERQNPGSWPFQLGYVAQWLSYVKRELDAPPLWEQLALGQPLLEVPLEAAEDRPFARDEQEAVRERLEEVREYLRRELAPGTMPAIEAQLARLEAALGTMGRVSWLQWAVGIMYTLIWGGLMAPEQARTVLHILGQAFQRLIGGG